MQDSPFDLQHLPFGIFGIWHLAFGIWHLALTPARSALLLSRPLLPLPVLQVPLGLRLRLAAAGPTLFRAPDPRENVGQAQVDLPALHVDLDHLHTDPVAEAV